MRVDTFGSDFDTVLAVYRGSALGSLSQVVCNDDNDGTQQSRASFTAEANVTYWIQVGGVGSGRPPRGNLVLNVTSP